MSKQRRKRFTFTEVLEITGVDRSTLVTFIEQSWIIPLSVDELDEQDLARIHFIRDIQASFGANDDAIPVILHLMDQLYVLRNQMRKLAESKS